MSEYIECRNCDSSYCNGCNVNTLSKMLRKGSFKRITDDHHSIIPVAEVVEVKHGNCSWCKPGDERCGTCVKFFDYHEDGGSDRCSSSAGTLHCTYYKPMCACPNCGGKMDGGADNG